MLVSLLADNVNVVANLMLQALRGERISRGSQIWDNTDNIASGTR